MVAEARGSALPWATATRTPPGPAPSGMEAALRLAGARPAAAARVGTGLDADRAGGAADRGVPVVDQRVHQHALLGDEVVHLLLRPADDRVDLDHLPPVVPLHDLGLATVAGLVPAQVAAQVGVASVEPGAQLGVLLFHGARRGDVDQLDRVHGLHRVPGAD